MKIGKKCYFLKANAIFFNATRKEKESIFLAPALYSPSKNKKRSFTKSQLTQDTKDRIGRQDEKYVFEQLQNIIWQNIEKQE